MYVAGFIRLYAGRRLHHDPDHRIKFLWRQDGLVEPQGLCQHRAGHYLAVVLHAQLKGSLVQSVIALVQSLIHLFWCEWFIV
jgi:hypothetical protein